MSSYAPLTIRPVERSQDVMPPAPLLVVTVCAVCVVNSCRRVCSRGAQELPLLSAVAVRALGAAFVAAPLAACPSAFPHRKGVISVEGWKEVQDS